jgi:GMP synthase-like glutamine amidotransferase
MSKKIKKHIHEKYGKKLLKEIAEDHFISRGQSVKANYEGSVSARIDGVIYDCAIEIESRVAKQIRGALLDLLEHKFSKKLLILIPAHINNKEGTVKHCEYILNRYKKEGQNTRVVLLEGTGHNEEPVSDIKKIKKALRALKVFMKILVIQNCKTESIGLYEEYLNKKGIDYHIFHAYTGKRFPPIKQFDAFIVAGTPISAYEIHKYRFLRNEWRYLKKVIKLDKPYLGICFGAQLLARMLGAKVRRNPVMEIGGYEVKLTSFGKKNRFFRGFPSSFPVFHWHGDTFDLPKKAKLLIKGVDCKNQAFSCNKAIALQFHLEVTSRQARIWADKYINGLKKVNKTKEQVVRESQTGEKKMKKLAFLLLDNFLKR